MKLPRSAADNVLALDLATSTGFAHGALAGRPRYGALALRGFDHIDKCIALRGWIEDQEKLHGQWTAIVVEAALLGSMSSQAAEALTLGLHTTVAVWCKDVSIPLLSVASSTARKNILGRGTFPKGEAKPAVGAWCRAQGYNPRGDDAADAILLFCAVQRATLGALVAA